MPDRPEPIPRVHHRGARARAALFTVVFVLCAYGAWYFGRDLDTSHLDSQDESFIWKFPLALLLGISALGSALYVISCALEDRSD